MNTISINGEVFSLMFSEAEILRRIKEIARTISTDYLGKTPIFVGVLNGAVIFLSDLVREVTVDLEVDFLKLSSYGDEKFSSGSVKLLKDFDVHIGGRDILIVEDIVDTGLSIEFIKKLVFPRNPASVKVVTLLHKKKSQQNQNIEYVGFEIPDEFVIGYGLDHSQKYRNLRGIYRLTK
ncbi:MAG: hypoxanthine phosphoribosyltransferase [Ignavibacteriales bacterium]|nr:hypoxanthine phosphoribosyltransferase [Ignavibacteriales bacterium]